MGGTQLVENRRQIHAWERAALAELRTGDPETAFDIYRDRGRVYHAQDSERVREQLVDDWWTARARKPDSIMIASRRADVDDLNHRARHRLATAKRLGPDELIACGRAFAVGDEVLAARNDYQLGILNGTRATITRIDHATETIHARRGCASHEIVFPRGYAGGGYLTHAYAMTFHKAQGMTATESFVLGDDTLDRQRAYTGLSRGTHRNALYIESSGQTNEEQHAPSAVNDAVARARLALARTLAKSMATDQVEPSRGPATAPTRGAPSRPPPAPPDLGPDLGL
ncbi:MAG: hypothetical protein ACR2IR_11580 [Acidimicrobiia bacterium]